VDGKSDMDLVKSLSRGGAHVVKGAVHLHGEQQVLSHESLQKHRTEPMNALQCPHSRHWNPAVPAMCS
jgi:hypothetical protein